MASRSLLRLPLRGLAAASILAFATSAAAFDRISFEYGRSDNDSNVNRFGAALKWDWGKRWLDMGPVHLNGHFEAGINYWDSDSGRTGNDSLVDFHLTPVFRLEGNATSGFAPHFEAGVGVHVHTDNEIEDLDFDLPFAFGSHVGVGARFGPRLEYELVYRYQHLSNADLGDDNPGINFHLIQLGYRF